MARFLPTRQSVTSLPMTSPKTTDVLWLIAAFKLLEALLILVVAVGALKLLHRDVGSVVADWITALRIDPQNEHIHWLLSKLGFLDDRRLKEIGAGSFVYAALRLTEGIGLLFRQRWAEYLVVIATGLLIPLEIHEIFRRVSVPRIAVLAINLAVVWYLIINLRRTSDRAPAS